MFPFEDEATVNYDLARWWLLKSSWIIVIFSALAFWGFQLVTVVLFGLAKNTYFDPRAAFVGFPLLLICGFIVIQKSMAMVRVLDPFVSGKKLAVSDRPTQATEKPAPKDDMTATVDQVDAVIEKRGQDGNWVSADDAL